MTRDRLRGIGAACRRLAGRCRSSRLCRDETASVAVEFGMVAIPFFTLVFAILQIAIVFLADQVLESAVANSARMIRTGQVTSTNTTAANFKTQYVCPNLYGLFDCSKLWVDVQSPSNFSSAALTAPTVNQTSGAIATSTNYATGGSAQIVVVRVYYLYPVLFSNFGLSLSDEPNGMRLLGAVSAFRNEPF